MILRRLVDKTVLRMWLVLAVISTVLSLIVYGAVQQTLRTSANDPQIQLAEDIGKSLSAGKEVDNILPTNSVDISHSLGTFVILYDDNGQVVTGNGQLGSEAPSLPSGVLAYTKENQEDVVTWQPEKDVRIAAVVYRHEGPVPGFVLAGRNLREVEKRIRFIGYEIIAGWAVALISTMGVLLVTTPKSKK
ncbi:MAG TPA: hypothetical protein VLG25_02855 [Patescibacteria group bacterium]|nr:hypothetical protein [Patescibacteria group bacterium]